MGIDLVNIESFAVRDVGLAEYRKKLHTYLLQKMNNIAPSLSTLIGEQVGARLIAHAGSLTNLAKYPASTLQILGAEKALFRALKTRGNTPKYGLIFHSTFIGRAGAKNKGRISRYLANKCSIASRIDCFSETPTTIFGDHLRKQVEDRLKFYETGDTPLKNEDVMKLAIEEAAHVAADLLKKEKKKKKKKQKESNAADDSIANTTAETSQIEDQNMSTNEVAMEVSTSNIPESDINSADVELSAKKKKKKKEKAEISETEVMMMETEISNPETNTESSAKKKKKKRKSDVETININDSVNADIDNSIVNDISVIPNITEEKEIIDSVATTEISDTVATTESATKKKKKEE